MHRLIKDRLEDHLNGAPGTQLPPECEDHLKACEECREELALMQEQADLLRVLRSSGDVEPRPGFYARVMERIELQEQASIWTVFLQPAFGRRLVLASLTFILLLGGYLAFMERETLYQPASADAIMANQEHPPDLGTDPDRDRDTILVNLATYRE